MAPLDAPDVVLGTRREFLDTPASAPEGAHHMMLNLLASQVDREGHVRVTPDALKVR